MDAAQLKADIVLLIDLITEHSRKVELVTHEDLQDEFLSKAPLNSPFPVSQIKPNTKPSRKWKESCAISRRQPRRERAQTSDLPQTDVSVLSSVAN